MTQPYKGYTATVEFDSDEMVLHGRVDGIRDVVTFQALSTDRVQPAFVEAVDDYLTLCDERGEEPHVPSAIPTE
jgi:predicted HicB family RNase H-like nuclease